jgi:hypothetical protein
MRTDTDRFALTSFRPRHDPTFELVDLRDHLVYAPARLASRLLEPAQLAFELFDPAVAGRELDHELGVLVAQRRLAVEELADGGVEPVECGSRRTARSRRARLGVENVAPGFGTRVGNRLLQSVSRCEDSTEAPRSASRAKRSDERVPRLEP